MGRGTAATAVQPTQTRQTDIFGLDTTSESSDATCLTKSIRSIIHRWITGEYSAAHRIALSYIISTLQMEGIDLVFGQCT